MVIDIHTHCFPDTLAKNALAKLSRFANSAPFYTDGTLSGLKASMQKSGVDYSVIQHIATRPAQTPSVNRFAAEINGGGIISFGSLHPEYPKWRDELKFIIESNLKGIKFHPDYQDFCVDEKRLYPLYEAIAKAGLPVLFHAGVDLGYAPPYKCMPDKLRKVVKDFPGMKIIAAHMGAHDYWDDVDQYLLGEDLYLDTSYSIFCIERARMVSMIRAHGANKVLLGTDSPWKDQKDTIDEVYALGLSESETHGILGHNAAKLLNLIE